MFSSLQKWCHYHCKCMIVLSVSDLLLIYTSMCGQPGTKHWCRGIDLHSLSIILWDLWWKNFHSRYHVRIYFSLKLPPLFPKIIPKSTQMYTTIPCILICLSTSLSPCFIKLDNNNFVKVSHYKWVLETQGVYFLMKILQKGTQVPTKVYFLQINK